MTPAVEPAVHTVALIGGDGIGPEVLDEGRRLLDEVARADGTFVFEFTALDWGSDYYLAHGRMLPEDGLDQLARFDAIYLGAVGDPRVPDHVTLWGLLLPIRQRFDLYVNLRPARLLPGVATPLVGRGAADLDIVFVRENSEGEYSGKGDVLYPGTPDEIALQIAVFSRRRIDRLVRYGFELARQAGRSVTSVSKGNALNYSAVLWDRVVAEVAVDYPDVPWRSLLVDAAALHMVQDPASFEIVVGSNLFIDILSDLGAALVGGLGLAPSANLDPEHRGGPSMFEPVHGSAPDIAGQGVANPLATLWAASMLLDHLGHPTWGARVLAAIESVLAAGTPRTPDLGGKAKTADMTDAVIARLV